jgi:hypothetical protein
MLNFHPQDQPQEQQNKYEFLRNEVLSKYDNATLKEDNQGFSIIWQGIILSDTCSSPFEAWLDASLPF